jgi:MFS family permease
MAQEVTQTTPRRHLPGSDATRFLGWWILAVSGVAVFTSSFGLTYTVSVYVDPMLAELGLSRTLFSFAYAVGTATGGLVLLLGGPLLERWGSRRVMVIGAIGLSSGLIVLSLAAGPWWLFLGFPVIRTFGQGTMPLTARVLIPNWFFRQRARAFACWGSRPRPASPRCPSPTPG